MQTYSESVRDLPDWSRNWRPGDMARLERAIYRMGGHTKRLLRRLADGWAWSIAIYWDSQPAVYCESTLDAFNYMLTEAPRRGQLAD